MLERPEHLLAPRQAEAGDGRVFQRAFDRHAIDVARPLMLGRVPDAILLHVAVLLAYAAVAYYFALALTRRRLLK